MNIMLPISSITFLMMTACFAPTKAIITEFDQNGNILKTTKTSESIVKSITNSTQNKSVYIYDNSFIVYFSATSATIEDPTPTFRFGVGKSDKGYLSLLKNHSLRDASKLIEKARAQVKSSDSSLHKSSNI